MIRTLFSYVSSECSRQAIACLYIMYQFLGNVLPSEHTPVFHDSIYRIHNCISLGIHTCIISLIASFRGDMYSSRDGPDIRILAVIRQTKWISVIISGIRLKKQIRRIPDTHPYLFLVIELVVSQNFSKEDHFFVIFRDKTKMSFHKPKVYRSVAGCCICKAKSSR